MRALSVFVLALAGCSLPSASADGGTRPHPDNDRAAPPATASATTSAVASAAASTPPPAASAPPAAAAASIAPPPMAEVPFVVPRTIAPGEKRPLFVYLHGLGASGKLLESRLELPRVSAERRFVYLAPDGEKDSKGQRFWNASKACCNLDNKDIDHVAFFRHVVAEARKHPSIDPSRIYFVGYSNGGFMAHRVACEVEGVAGIASVAGAGPADGERCSPAGKVTVLQVHGDADDVIRYEGGNALRKASLPRHPSARETVQGWASRDGCQGGGRPAGTLDLDEQGDDEVSVLRFDGCARPVELWTVKGGNHFIATGQKAHRAIVDHLDRTQGNKP